MTSIAATSSAPQANTTNASTSSTAHARTPSISGQSTSAAVPANAPSRALSYANVVNPKKLPTGPGAASASNTAASSQVSGGVSAQHARSASTTSVPVNGKIQPAVPQIGNTGNTIANGASAPYSGGQHSRKPSIATGAMLNGASRGAPNIKFGGFSETGSGPQPSGTAVAAGTNLTAPMAINPRATSPSPATAQPVASGGAPPSASSTRPIQFGDTTPQTRPISLPPQPHVPQGPNSMASRGHNRHDSAQSSHTDSGAPHGRGMPMGRRAAYGQSYTPTYSGYARSYQGPGPQRSGPANMGGAPPYAPQQYPNSPRQVPRSPALTHVQTAHHSPSMSAAVPTTPQLYPPPHGQPFIPGSPYPPVQQMYQDPTAYYQPQHYPMAYAQQPYQTSPRPQYSQAVPQMAGGGYNLYTTQAPPMSRSSSANVPGMHDRPPSSIGHHPQPSMTPQPQHLVSPAQPGTPGPPVPPNSYYRPVPPRANAIEIRNPNTGATVKIDKPAPSPVASTPVIVSSPSPAPGRPQSRPEGPHSRSTSRSNKTTEEKRKEMRDKVLLEAKKAEEEAKKAAEDQKRKESEAEAERLRKEEEDKLKTEEEAKQAAERSKKEAEERAKAEAEAAEAAAKKEAEEKALKGAEEKAQKEAEEKAQKEAEEKAQKEAEEKAAKEAEEKAKAEAEAEAKEAEAAKAKAEAEKPIPSTPVLTPASTPKASTPDSDAMPPPSLKLSEKPRSKPSPLNLQIKTNEPGPPSAALTALRSARPVENLKHLQYPEGIQSPNPALNPMANATKFKYDKEFLMQFQQVFTEKPSVDWDQRMRETVGDTELARPSIARTPSGMGTRSTSSRGTGIPNMGGAAAMGSYSAFPKPPSMERFAASNKPVNSMSSMMGSIGSITRPVGLVRTGSSTSLSGSTSNATASSPRIRSARGNSKRGAGGAGGAPMERSDSRQQTSGPTIPLADVKPLPLSANRWTPRSLKAATEPQSSAAPIPGDNMLSPEMVQRKVKAALNKMTPEKFDKISDQILEITAQSKHESDGRTLRQVIQLTFEKATDEAHWASMYAKFCKRMLETMDPNIKDENIKDKAGAVVTGGNLFRKYLLNRCQEEFERGWKVNLPPAPEGVSEEVLMLSDEYYIAAAAKRRGLGLVQFIGELFKLGMLTERIMNECVRKLLDFEGLPEDETVESLTKLLRTIGSQLDASEKSKSLMDMYFQRIHSMAENSDLNSRMRFMLMDIEDLRKKGWESKEANKGPKTIQEVRDEAIKAQQEKEAISRANRGNRPQGGRGDSRSFSGGGYGGMHPPGNSGGSVNPEDLRRLSNRSKLGSGSAPQFGPPLTLGPRGSGSRRGLGPNVNRDDSNPSSRTATPPVPASTSTPNMFALLEASHNDGNDATSPPPSNANSPQVSNAKPVAEESK